MQRIETSDTMKSIWVLMLKSKESAEPAASVWEGLCRINRLASEYVKEHYGAAAIEFKGKFYTPDCEIITEQETAQEKRARLKAGDSMLRVIEPPLESPTLKEFEAFKKTWLQKKGMTESQFMDLCEEVKVIRQ